MAKVERVNEQDEATEDVTPLHGHHWHVAQNYGFVLARDRVVVRTSSCFVAEFFKRKLRSGFGSFGDRDSATLCNTDNLARTFGIVSELVPNQLKFFFGLGPHRVVEVIESH